MQTLTEWTMRVDVIHTTHMPSPNPDFGREFVWAPQDDPWNVTFMVLIADLDPDAPEWLTKLRDAIEALGTAPEWVRFDDSAEQVEGLPLYKWS